MKVVDIDREISSHNEYMGERYLVVDEEITDNWAHFFEQQHANYFSTMKREIRVVDQNIVVNCPMAELQSQIDVIKRHCVNADKALALWEAQQEQIKQQEASEQQDAATKANRNFDNLKF